MDRNHHSSESGQALVLITLAMVVLLGFTALAVDGGMVYADRRYAQNGADSTSLAGAGAGANALGYVVTSENWTTNVPGNCRDGNAAPAAQRAKEAAVARAAQNDFTIAPVIHESEFETESNAVWTECGEMIIQPYGYHRKFMDVFVKTTHDTPTSFAHFVFKGLARNTTTAVSRIYPAEPFGFGEAIIALNPSDACNPVMNGAVFFGGPDVYVNGGGILSNGCVIAKDPTINVTIDDGGVYYGTGLNVDEDAFTLNDGSFEELDEPLRNSTFNPPVPDCTGHTVDAGWLVNRTDLHDLYCVTGNLNLKCNGPNCDTMVGNNVTFVMLGGTVTINSNAVISITAPPKNYAGPAMPGILFYLPFSYYGNVDGSGCGNVNQELKINGNSSNTFTGTILAPCSDISIEGTATSFMFNAQIIGWNVNVGGTSGTSVFYDDAQNGYNPGNVNLFR